MTQKEAYDLQLLCESYLSKKLGEDVQLSLALSGKIKVSIEAGDSFTLTKDMKEIEYIDYTGWIDSLKDICNIIIKCVNDNRERFEQLLWSYQNIKNLT